MKKDFKLIINRFFDAAHRLPDSADLVTKACARFHGHTYLARVTFNGINDRHGMAVDFKGIKNIIDLLDHRFINEIFWEHKFMENSEMFNNSKDPHCEACGIYDLTKVPMVYPATAENIARFIYKKIREEYPDLENLEVGICEGFKDETNSSFAYYTEYEELLNA